LPKIRRLPACLSLDPAEAPEGAMAVAVQGVVRAVDPVADREAEVDPEVRADPAGLMTAARRTSLHRRSGVGWISTWSIP